MLKYHRFSDILMQSKMPSDTFFVKKPYCFNDLLLHTLKEHLIQKSDVPVLLNLSAFYTLLSWQCGIKVLKVCRLLLRFRGGAEPGSSCMYFICSSPLLLAESCRWSVETCLRQEETEGMGAGFHLTGREDFTLAVWLQADYASMSGCQWVFCRGLWVWHTATLTVITSQTTHEGGGVRVTHGWLKP